MKARSRKIRQKINNNECWGKASGRGVETPPAASEALRCLH